MSIFSDNTLYVDQDWLAGFRDSLQKRKEQIIAGISALRSRIIALDWSDNIYDSMLTVINNHFRSMNILLSGIDDALTALDKMDKALDNYFRCARNL